MSNRRKIYESAVETLEIACYMFPVEEDEADHDWDKDAASDYIQSVVNFEGGTNGMVVITPSDSLLTAMAANMLGIDSPDESQKEEALCEIANIIAGNLAPHFSDEDEICYINPPKLFKGDDKSFKTGDTLEESVQVYLDEGVVEIEVYYQTKEQ